MSLFMCLGTGRERLRGMQGEVPCPESRGQSARGRVQGDSACARCKGKTLAGNPKGCARGPVEVLSIDTLYWVLPVEKQKKPKAAPRQTKQ